MSGTLSLTRRRFVSGVQRQVRVYEAVRLGASGDLRRYSTAVS